MDASKETKTIYKHFEQFAPSYPKYRKRYRYYWRAVVNFFNYYIHPDHSVLEIGCGTGETLAALKGKSKTGIDFSPAMVRVAHETHPELDIRLMDAADIQLDRTYDVVVLSHVIGYLDNVQDVMESVRKVCHPRTRILVSYYNFFWEPVLELAEWFGLKRKSPRQNWLSEIDIRHILTLSGFESFRAHRGMLFPVNIPVLSWLLNKYMATFPLLKGLCLNKYICARPIPEPAPGWERAYTTTVVIPARNEEGNIAAALERLPEFGKSIEVIFVEGNSTDQTWQRIQEVVKTYDGPFTVRMAQQEGKGKGDAVRKGYGMATGDILMILDADLTVPPEELPKFYNAIASGKGDFINGSRLVYPMEKQAMRFLNLLGNKFFSKAFSWLLNNPVKDTLCGTKVLFRSDYEKLALNRSYFGEFDPFGDFDLLFGAHKMNLKIIDLPIRYRERTYGDTNISRFSHGLLLLRMCIYAAQKIKFRII
ncbi:MAG: glycosyltransferase [Flavobacteriales bacterium]|nr:glycosyltransferase [Flavobacteriales bacterium]MCB9448797.1 glycosyltransferase [Flavobacteriales bacterium]